MPFIKEWGSKPMVAAYPYSTNGQIVCHNCYVSWPKEHMNVCTGLCGNCVKENPVPIKENRENRTGERHEHQCRKCLQPLNHTNFGVNRDICEACMVEHPLRQRCLACDKYTDDCWNNVCRKCRPGTMFCEYVGHFYATDVQHDRTCWCVGQEVQFLRYGIGFPKPESWQFLSEPNPSKQEIMDAVDQLYARNVWQTVYQDGSV